MEFEELLKIFKEILKGLKEGIKEKSIDHIEAELKDLEEAFGIIVLSPLIGFPLFSNFISISLLPYLEREITIILSRTRFQDDFTSFWFHLADI